MCRPCLCCVFSLPILQVHLGVLVPECCHLRDACVATSCPRKKRQVRLVCTCINPVHAPVMTLLWWTSSFFAQQLTQLV